MILWLPTPLPIIVSNIVRILMLRYELRLECIHTTCLLRFEYIYIHVVPTPCNVHKKCFMVFFHHPVILLFMRMQRICFDSTGCPKKTQKLLKMIYC